MKQQTAMQRVLSLVEQMYNNADALKLELPASLLNDIINIITQEGIPIEREQIIKAYAQGVVNEISIYTTISGLEYYNETYGE